MAKNEVELSPLRSLDDFLLGSAKFQLPNYKDLEKWGNRVEQNLLYYQTNYFVVWIITILIVTLLHPLKMMSGALSVVVMFGLFYYSVNATSSSTTFRKNHPLLGVFLIFSGACLVVYLLGSLLVFLFGILLPISMIFIHASLRLRNIKNKLSNIERVISKKTPMSVLLESLERSPTDINLLAVVTNKSDRSLGRFKKWTFSFLPFSFAFISSILRYKEYISLYSQHGTLTTSKNKF